MLKVARAQQAAREINICKNKHIARRRVGAHETMKAKPYSLAFW
jgi:hypothetical protein